MSETIINDNQRPCCGRAFQDCSCDRQSLLEVIHAERQALAETKRKLARAEAIVEKLPTKIEDVFRRNFRGNDWANAEQNAYMLDRSLSVIRETVSEAVKDLAAARKEQT